MSLIRGFVGYNGLTKTVQGGTARPKDANSRVTITSQSSVTQNTHITATKSEIVIQTIHSNRYLGQLKTLAY